MLYTFDDNDKAQFNKLLLPFHMPHGVTIAEEYIQMLIHNSSYDLVYTESETYGIELPDHDTLEATFIKL